MAQRSIARRTAGTGILLLSALLLWGPGPAVAQLQHIVTETEILAETFVANYDPDRLRAIELAAAAELAGNSDGFGGPFGFLDWKPDGETPDEPAARLVLRVTEEETAFGPKISLSYAAALGNGVPTALDAMLRPEDAVLYMGFETDFPSHDPEKLEQDLLARVRQHCATQTVQDFLEEKVLGEIPLAADLSFDTARKKLTFTESIQQLRASEDSRFKIELVAPNASGLDTKGEMIVAPQLPPPEHKAIIHYLFFDQILVRENDRTAWHERLASIMPAKKELWIYMKHWDEDLGIGSTSPPGPPSPERQPDF